MVAVGRKLAPVKQLVRNLYTDDDDETINEEPGSIAPYEIVLFFKKNE